MAAFIQVYSQGGPSRNQSCVKRVANKSSHIIRVNSQIDLTNSESLNDDDVIGSNVGADGNNNHLTFTLNEGSGNTNVNAKKEAMLKHSLAQILKSDDLIDILCEPEENIPSGRKRPSRQKSKARVMTDNTLTSNLQRN